MLGSTSISKEQARTALNAIRGAIGVASLLAPRHTARLFAIDPRQNPAMPYMTRLFGVRELFIVGVSADPSVSDDVFRYGMAVDAVDYAAAVAARLSGRLPGRALVTGALGLALAIGLGRLASEPSGPSVPHVSERP